MSSQVMPLLLLGAGVLLLTSGKKKSSKPLRGSCTHVTNKQSWVRVSTGAQNIRFPFILVVYPHTLDQSNVSKLIDEFCAMAKKNDGLAVIVSASNLANWENRISAQPSVSIMFDPEHRLIIEWDDVVRGGLPAVEEVVAEKTILPDSPLIN